MLTLTWRIWGKYIPNVAPLKMFNQLETAQKYSVGWSLPPKKGSVYSHTHVQILKLWGV